MQIKRPQLEMEILQWTDTNKETLSKTSTANLILFLYFVLLGVLWTAFILSVKALTPVISPVILCGYDALIVDRVAQSVWQLSYGLDSPGSNPGGDEIFRSSQTGPGAHPASYKMGSGSFLGG